MTRFAALLALPLALAGCSGGGPSVSGSADEGASTRTGASSLSERTRSIGLDQVKTVDMPALGLMADAFLQDADARGEIPLRVRRMALIGPGGNPLRIDKLVEYEQPLPNFSRQVAQGTTLDLAHAGYANPILIALGPLNGWEINPMDDRRIDPAFDTPFFRRNRPPSNYKPELHNLYMEELSISAAYTDAVFARIGQSLAGARLADPDEARKRVLTAYQAIPPAELRVMLADAASQVERGQFTTDLASAHGIHFTHSGAGDFVGDARGVTWTRAGGTWFGDGRVNGQSINFKLVSTASQAQRQAQSGTTSTDADARVGGTASVGPAR